jgi:phage shock protein A
MTALPKGIETIERKVDMLLEYCDALKEQNELLLTENEQFKKSANELKTQLNELDERHNMLKLAKTVAGSDEKTLDIKAKINDFVREIDKCIAILNK